MADHPGVRSRYATLTVLMSPSDPVITQGDVFQATEDREVQLECVSANGKPAAEVGTQKSFVPKLPVNDIQ